MEISHGRVRGTLGGSLAPAGIPNGITFSSRKSFRIKENFDNQDVRAANPNSIISDSLSPSNFCEASQSTREASQGICEASQSTCEASQSDASQSTREASQSTREASQSTREASQGTPEASQGTCEASQSTCEASQSTSEASKSSCKAHIEDPPNLSNEVVESRLLWRKICWQLEGRFVHINKEKCALLHRWFNATEDSYHANIRSSAVTELCAAIPYAKYLVEECSHNEWLLKAVELWECTEHFVEVLLDISWSAYMMNLGVGNSEQSEVWMDKVDKLLNSRSEQNDMAKLLYEDSNDPDKTALGAMVCATLEDRDLEVDGADHQLASLLQDRLKPDLEKQIVWQPPFLKQHSFFIYSKFVVPLQSSCKAGAHGAILKLPWVYEKEFAVKMRHPNEDSSKTFKREFDILDKYRSPFIVGVVGYWEVESWSSWNLFTNKVQRCPFLLMENLECDLNDLMDRCKTTWEEKRGGFSDLEAIKLMLPVAKALRFLHGKDVAHRDVKPRNIMCRNVVVPKDQKETVVNENTIVKLIDFGEAMENVLGLARKEWGPAGTPGYMDPAMWEADATGYTLFMGDVFSFAMVFAELLTWRSPLEAFDVSCVREMRAKLTAGERPTLPKSLPNYIRFIVESCWCADPLKRPDFKAVCSMLQHAKILLLDMEPLDELEEFFVYEDALGGECCISDKSLGTDLVEVPT